MKKKEAELSNEMSIVVIGASAGGLSAISTLLSGIDSGINASFFVVLHLAKNTNAEILISKIQSKSSLKCSIAQNNIEFRKGQVYLAPAGRHLLVTEDNIRLGTGPSENRWRPSINILFRSAAVNHSVNVIGIILSGMLDDGTSGMDVIKKCGGTTIVQDPKEAEFPDMPLSVLENVDVDYSLLLENIGKTVKNITTMRKKSKNKIPDEIKAEASIEQNVSIGMDNLEPLGDHSIFTCPDCGGVLWKIKNEKLDRYRCYTGHSYTAKELTGRLEENSENALWTALRTLEERRNLFLKLIKNNNGKNFARLNKEYKNKADAVDKQIDNLRNFILSVNDNS
jgi:two-component system chemotaxis response regulator CheB